MGVKHDLGSTEREKRKGREFIYSGQGREKRQSSKRKEKGLWLRNLFGKSVAREEERETKNTTLFSVSFPRPLPPRRMTSVFAFNYVTVCPSFPPPFPKLILRSALPLFCRRCRRDLKRRKLFFFSRRRWRLSLLLLPSSPSNGKIILRFISPPFFSPGKGVWVQPRLLFGWSWCFCLLFLSLPLFYFHLFFFFFQFPTFFLEKQGQFSQSASKQSHLGEEGEPKSKWAHFCGRRKGKKATSSLFSSRSKLPNCFFSLSPPFERQRRIHLLGTRKPNAENRASPKEQRNVFSKQFPVWILWGQVFQDPIEGTSKGVSLFLFLCHEQNEVPREKERKRKRKEEDREKEE